MPPRKFGECLLHNECRRVIRRHRDVRAVAPFPTPSAVRRSRAQSRHAQIAVSLVERRQPVLIGIEPQRRFAVGETRLHLRRHLQICRKVLFLLREHAARPKHREHREFARNGLHIHHHYTKRAVRRYILSVWRGMPNYFTTPSARPTFTNAATALSRCSRSWPADSWTRMRA